MSHVHQLSDYTLIRKSLRGVLRGSRFVLSESSKLEFFVKGSYNRGTKRTHCVCVKFSGDLNRQGDLYLDPSRVVYLMVLKKT